MSNLPASNNSNLPGAPPVAASSGQQVYNHNQLTASQPYFGLQQDSNSNSPIHGPITPQGPTHIMTNYNQSANSSPAFNRPGILPPSLSGLPPSMLPPMKPNSIIEPSPSQYPPLQPSQAGSQPVSKANTPTPYVTNNPNQQGQQINDNAPPLVPSSQAFQPVMNGPLGSGPVLPPSSAPHTVPYLPSSRAFSPPVSRPPVSAHNFGPPGSVQQSSSLQYGVAPLPPKPGPPLASQASLMGLTSAASMFARHSPTISGSPASGMVAQMGPPKPLGVNGSSMNAGMSQVRSMNEGGSMNLVGPPISQPGPMNQAGPLVSQPGLMNHAVPRSLPGPPLSQSGPMNQAGPLVSQPGPMNHAVPRSLPGPLSQPGPMNQAGPLVSQPGPINHAVSRSLPGPPLSQAGPINQAGPLVSQPGPINNAVPRSLPGPPLSQPGPMNQAGPMSQPGFRPPMSQPGPMYQSGPPMSQVGTVNQAGPLMSQPGSMNQTGLMNQAQPSPINQARPSMSQPGLINQTGPPMSQPSTMNQAGPPRGHIMGGPLLRPNAGPTAGPPTNVAMMGPMGPPPSSATYSSSNKGPLQMGPQIIGQPAGPHQKGLVTGPPLGPLGQPNHLQPGLQSAPQSLQGTVPSGQPLVSQQPPTSLQGGPQSLPPNITPPGPMAGPPKSNMQSRYPAMPQTNYGNQTHPQNYNTQQMTQQMGNLSVTKQGFDQLWGHQNIDLMQCRHILPEYPEDPPEIRLGHQFADAPNCSPDIFRCTINRIPENNSLLQKSRLPLGILIHPFKDLNHLPVIQCATIVRCRACRTYINPFVYFVDAKRWKCNLCYRVNDLPDEFQYDPVSKSYGDPSRRPEIKSATIEFIAPGEYMLRPPQPAVYLFLLDVSQLARESRYLEVVCDTLQDNLNELPGDARTQVGFICYDSHIHYYLMSEGLTRPKEMTVLDIDDVFLPSPESLLVNLGEKRAVITELLAALPARHSGPGSPASALGAALQAAYKLMAPTGGRITVFQTCLPNVGPGALAPREDPNARSAKDVAHLNPATDFYKRLALDCSGAQIGVDLFLLNSQYSDLATLSGMSKFSGGTVYHIPLFSAARAWQADQLRRMFHRYLTRKIGFEAVMRVRCTRGVSIHTFHGNFFVRSTDLLSLPNVSPDAGFGMQLSIEESLADLQQVCFQAALLYTSSKGERRIRVHTLALPIATTLPDVLHSADQQCIIGLLSKMAVDRCASASMSEAREAITNVAIDVLSAHRLAQNLPVGAASNSLFAPASLRLLPLYLLALLKRKAFRTGTSTRLDDRVADMCNMKTLPLPQLLRAVYPDLFPVHQLTSCEEDPPTLQLSAEKVNSTGAYLLDDGETMILYVGHAVSPAYLSETFDVASFSQLPDEARTLPRFESEENQLLHLFIEKLNEDRPFPSNLLLLRDNSPSRALFTERLVDDRVENSFAYYEFLQHVKSQVK